MTVRVLLFGHYRDIAAPDGTLTVEAPAGVTTADLARLLAAQNPRLADLLARTRVAVNAEFADPNTSLADGDEVAFLPPMSGG